MSPRKQTKYKRTRILQAGVYYYQGFWASLRKALPRARKLTICSQRAPMPKTLLRKYDRPVLEVEHDASCTGAWERRVVCGSVWVLWKESKIRTSCLTCIKITIYRAQETCACFARIVFVWYAVPGWSVAVSTLLWRAFYSRLNAVWKKRIAPRLFSIFGDINSLTYFVGFALSLITIIDPIHSYWCERRFSHRETPAIVFFFKQKNGLVKNGR